LVLDRIKETVGLLDDYLEEKAITNSTHQALATLVESIGMLV
jgi:hypothetical protein